MKILFVLDYYYPFKGGSEILFQSLAEGLVKKGYDVTVVTMRVENSLKYEVYNGVKIHRLPSLRFLPRFSFMKLVFPWLLFNGKKFDLIHTTSCGSSVPAWLVSKLYRIPSVITVHEVIGKNWKVLYGMGNLMSFFYRNLERIMLSFPFKKYIPVSKSTEKGLYEIGVNPEKIDVVHNAVDYEHWNPKKYNKNRVKIRNKLGVKKNEFLYVFYGRPGETKGVNYLIKAMPEINKKIPRARALLILGTEPVGLYKDMKKMLKDLGGGKAILHKPLPYKDLPNYIMAGDCVVVPSITEGFGFCVAESCALGKPVVASNTTSIPEVISGKYLLVPPRDSGAIADALVKVTKKKYSKSSLKKFTFEKFIKGYEKVYNDVI